MAAVNNNSGANQSKKNTGAGIPRVKPLAPIDPNLCYSKQLLCQTMGLKKRGWTKLVRDLAKLNLVPKKYQTRVYVMGAWVVRLIMEEGRG